MVTTAGTASDRLDPDAEVGPRRSAGLSHGQIPLSKDLISIGLVVLGWALSVTLSTQVTSTGRWFALALAVHVVSLAVALGAVIVSDLHGMLWMTGRLRLHEAFRVISTVTPLVWLGYAGLLASGAALHPRLAIARTWIKLSAVLLVGLNGVVVHRQSRALNDLPDSSTLADLPRRTRWRLMGSAAISTAAWGAAVVVGLAASTRFI